MCRAENPCPHQISATHFSLAGRWFNQFLCHKKRFRHLFRKQLTIDLFPRIWLRFYFQFVDAEGAKSENEKTALEEDGDENLDKESEGPKENEHNDQ